MDKANIDEPSHAIQPEDVVLRVNGVPINRRYANVREGVLRSEREWRRKPLKKTLTSDFP